jgi:hypothetical protein
MIKDFVIVKEHKNIISYVDKLQKQNSEALSFYPKCVFEREQEKGRLYLSLLNNEPCGYMYVGSFRSHTVKVHQVCIDYDLRRRLYGTALVSTVEDDCLENHCHAIQLRCGFDLLANDFWFSSGFKCVEIVDGGVRRNRKINVWRKQLDNSLFEDLHIEPAKGKTSSTIWKKNKKTGLISSFHRGKKLAEYRKLIYEENNNTLQTQRTATTDSSGDETI